MFNNTSSKIKTVAKILFFVLAIPTFIIGVFCLVTFFIAIGDSETAKEAMPTLLEGIGLGIIGPFVSYAIALAYYGLGIMVSKQEEQAKSLYSIDHKFGLSEEKERTSERTDHRPGRTEVKPRVTESKPRKIFYDDY